MGTSRSASSRGPRGCNSRLGSGAPCRFRKLEFWLVRHLVAAVIAACGCEHVQRRGSPDLLRVAAVHS